eukprot:9744124-Heterocapsa_arctica.AAC.1
MKQYFRSAVQAYVEITGEKMNKVASPYVPRLELEDMDNLIQQKGRHAQHSASVLMKLMYGTWMAMPSLCVIVRRLASQITKWTADSDRRLRRVYCYIKGALDIVLTG